MRNGLPFLFVIGAAILGFFVLLPILGIILLVIAGALIIGLVAFLAAPLLARLPWFRDRIFVENVGGRRFVRFGRSSFTSYRGGGGPYGQEPYQEPYQNPAPGRLDQGDVIDVEGREIADEDDPHR